MDVDVLPDLQKWSDVMFLEWQQHVNPANIRNIKKISRAGIANPDSKNQVVSAFTTAGMAVVPAWPGHTFSIDASTFLDPVTGRDPHSFFAILGSKNGAGAAYMLSQHKAAFGLKTVTPVRSDNGSI